MSAHFNRCKNLSTVVLDSRSGKDVLVLQANVHVSPAHGRGPVRRKLPPRLASCQDQLELSGVQKKITPKHSILFCRHKQNVNFGVIQLAE